MTTSNSKYIQPTAIIADQAKPYRCDLNIYNDEYNYDFRHQAYQLHSTGMGLIGFSRPFGIGAVASVVGADEILGSTFLESPWARIAKSYAEDRFKRHLSDWLANRNPFKSDSSDVMHPSYQKIIGMGELALPFIFNVLNSEVEPSNWFWALKAITDDDPVPEEHIGDVLAMKSDWLQWGWRRGYLDASFP
jgi:hypothetical protein